MMTRASGAAAMQTLAVLLALGTPFANALPASDVNADKNADSQIVLSHSHSTSQAQVAPPKEGKRKLRGRFLHITDFHPDDFYKPHTTPDNLCHRGNGAAGIYGAETTECDSPLSLVNATFDWIQQNIKDDVDFVIWTGDSARHDGDEDHPRRAEEVLRTNRFISDKFVETFSTKDGMTVPVIPTFGNNDFLPHNIFDPGPNKWLAAYTDIWRHFIPEEQRHSFQFGGWFYVEVIPGKLAVFSLNTMYFFDRNAAVDGCALPSEPGYKHMEWLRVQLQLMRSRGVKAMLMGHVPPARTDSKQLWDETCWQRYTLWLKQYRDVVVASLYGHMNIDHFLLSDSKEVDLRAGAAQALKQRSFLDVDGDDGVSITGKKDYLDELCDQWADLPKAAGKIKDAGEDAKTDVAGKKGKGHKKKGKKKKFRKIGGKYAERYQATLVSPSVVPNYFPTLRIIEYNITGLEDHPVWKDSMTRQTEQKSSPQETNNSDSNDEDDEARLELRAAGKGKKRKGKKGKGKKPKDPNLTIPDGPPKGSSPGPAYLAQTLTLTSYAQWFVNLTNVNHETKGKKSKPREFKFEVEYDTRDDSRYQLKDLTVRSLLKLAYRIGQGTDAKANGAEISDLDPDMEPGVDDLDDEKIDRTAGGGKKKKKGKGKKRGGKAWLAFLSRAFVGTVSEDELNAK